MKKRETNKCRAVRAALLEALFTGVFQNSNPDRNIAMSRRNRGQSLDWDQFWNGQGFTLDDKVIHFALGCGVSQGIESSGIEFDKSRSRAGHNTIKQHKSGSF